jgi:hypothetical protein
VELVLEKIVAEGGRTVDVLAESEEARVFRRQVSQSEVGTIWARLKSHMATVTVELPDECWIAAESLRSS